MSETPLANWAFDFADFRLHPKRRTLTRADGAAIELRGKAFDVLLYLVEHAGALVDRRVLLQALWHKRVVEDNNLTQTIAVVRRTLGEEHIVTVSGHGYQFVTPVRRVALAAEEDAQPAGPIESPTRLVARLAAAVIVVVVGAVVAGSTLPLDSWYRTTLPSPRLGAVSSNTLITAYPGAESEPSLSPDGARIAFSWDGDSGNRDIYVLEIGSGAPTRVTLSPEVDSDPTWSPDGERLAFRRHYDGTRFDVLVARRLGREEHRVASGEKLLGTPIVFPQLAWTPDGQHLLFTTKRSGPHERPSYGLHRVDLTSGAVVDLALLDDGYDTSPAVSADGAWLAFVRHRRGARLTEVMVQPLGGDFWPLGEARPLPGLDPGLYHSPAWSPTSDRLWFANDAEILEWDVGGSVRSVQTLGPLFSTRGIAIVRRGAATRAAVSTARDDEDIFALRLDPASHEAIGLSVALARSSAVDTHPRLSPDGTRLAFVSHRTGARSIWIAAADGTDARELAKIDGAIAGYPRWSPDGRRLAFHASTPGPQYRVTYIVDVESGRAETSFKGCCPGGWSADGQHVYVSDQTENPTRVVRVNVHDGNRQVLFEGELATESADGRYLLYAKSREPGLFRRSLDDLDAQPERLVTDYVVPFGGIAPVRDGFYYIGFTPEHRPTAIRFFDYGRREARDIAHVPAGTTRGLTVSVDGRELLYSAIDGTREADITLLQFRAEQSD